MMNLPPPIIHLADVNIWFGDGTRRIDVVRQLAFDVAAGESFGLVGESGSGKSTVLNALAGLIDSWHGEIVLNGQARYPGQSCFSKAVQMVFQDPYASLHPRHTVYNTLREPLVIHKMDQIEARIVATLEEVGLDSSYRFRYPHQLSGGQRQRLAIARALIIEPNVVLLDEPTSALDVSIQAEVLNLLQSLKKKRALSYLIVSHDLGVIAHMCSRIGVMQHGKIVETLSRHQLVEMRPTHPYTRQLLDSSLGYAKENKAQT